MNLQDSIVAIATAPGVGGVGILRISGDVASKALQALWQGPLDVAHFESHKLYRGILTHPRTGAELDQVLAVWMRAPHSYTGEEVIEIHAHGGPFLLNQILEVLLAQGLRLAEPGEFTRRAYLNGKIDLLQAEAVGEMIHAKSAAALKNAEGQLEGRVSKEVGILRQKVLDLLTRVEAAIDFPEEELEILSTEDTLASMAAIEKDLERWLEKFHIGRLIREGVRVALVGRPNVGKSSLLNVLVGEDKAIVHESPGTTRDVLEGGLDLEGIYFQLFDTAGIREGQEGVEKEGIARSVRTASRADLVLWVIDASEDLTAEDFHIARQLDGNILVVANKSDLGVIVQALPKAWDIPEKLQRATWMTCSATSGHGIDAVKKQMPSEVGLNTLQEKSHAYLNNARHKTALEDALSALRRAQKALREDLAAECVAADLKETTHALEALLGKVSTEDILDQIFSKFCIGK